MTTTRQIHSASLWVLKQRPIGDWVVDQYERTTGRVRRYGPYHSRDTAQEMLDELVKEPKERSYR